MGPGTIEVKVYSASDNAALLDNVQSLDEGGSVYFYWAAAPGQTYRVAVGRFGGGSTAVSRTPSPPATPPWSTRSSRTT